MRDNQDQVEVQKVRKKRWDTAEPAPVSLSWTRKDKIRDVRYVDNQLVIRYEDVPDWGDGIFGYLWAATRVEGEWVAEYVDDLHRGRETRVGTDPSGKAIMEQGVRGQAPSIPEPGKRAAWFISGAQVERLSANRVFTLEKDNSNMVGKDWPVRDGKAPVFLMAPTGTQSAETWRVFLDEILPGWIELGISGVWTPWLGLWRPEYKDLDIIARQNNLVVGGWFVSEQDLTGQEMWGREAAESILMRLIARYDAIVNAGHNPPDFVFGPTWDVWQAQGWRGVGDVNSFIDWGEKEVGLRKIYLGARCRVSPETGNPEQNYRGTYYADEAHIVNPSADADRIMVQTVRNAGDRPAASFDRFRVRHGGDGKDMVAQDMPKVIVSARAHNVAIIIGYPPVGGGNVSDLGSGPCTNPEAVRAALTGEVLPPQPPTPPTAPTDPDLGADYLIRTGQLVHNDDQRLVSITIGHEDFVDVERPDTFLWENPTDAQSHQEAIVPLNNTKPWAVDILDGFNGVLRGLPEEYTVTVSIASPDENGNPGHFVQYRSFESEKESTGSHNADLVFQYNRLRYIEPNSFLRIGSMHSIGQNAPHVSMAVKGWVLWNTVMSKGPDERKP